MKMLLLSAALLAVAVHPARALTILVDAEILKEASGAPMPVVGLVVLTTATSGSFFGPTALSFTHGSELLLQKWDLSSFLTEGILSDTTGDLPFSGLWDQGDALRLYWYPTLSLTSSEPGAGALYGTYSDPIGLDGSAPWITGAESDTLELKFFTSDASFLSSGGTNSPSAGLANLSVPEPCTVLSGFMVMGALAVARRRQ